MNDQSDDMNPLTSDSENLNDPIFKTDIVDVEQLKNADGPGFLTATTKISGGERFSKKFSINGSTTVSVAFREEGNSYLNNFNVYVIEHRYYDKSYWKKHALRDYESLSAEYVKNYDGRQTLDSGDYMIVIENNAFTFFGILDYFDTDIEVTVIVYSWVIG